MASFNVMLGAIRGFFTNTNSHFITELGKSATWVLTRVGGLIPDKVVEFFGTIKGVITDNLDIIAKDIGSDGLFKTLSTTFTTIGDMLGDAGFTFGGVAGTIGLVATAIASLTSAYGGLGGVIERIKKVFSDAWGVAKQFFEATGAAGAVERLKEAFGKLGEALKGIYDALGALKPV